jgi:K(+)-stimulated pyrophosphate-energized sodium pump
MKAKGTELHAATVVGDTVGDPFKDTSSVAMNPVIKFSTLFGLLAVELAVSVVAKQSEGLPPGQESHTLVHILAGVFLVISAFFVYRSFYGMQIAKGGTKVSSKHEKSPHIPATRF